MDPIVILTIALVILELNVLSIRIHMGMINKATESTFKNIFKLLENQNDINVFINKQINEIIKHEEEIDKDISILKEDENERNK